MTAALEKIIVSAIGDHAVTARNAAESIRLAVVREIVDHLSTTGAPSLRAARKRIAAEIAEKWGRP